MSSAARLRYFVILLIIGFIPTMAISWAFEWTPERKADLEAKLLKYCWVDTAAMVEIVRFLSSQ